MPSSEFSMSETTSSRLCPSIVSPSYLRSVQKSSPTDSKASSASYRALYASPSFSLANNSRFLSSKVVQVDGHVGSSQFPPRRSRPIADSCVPAAAHHPFAQVGVDFGIAVRATQFAVFNHVRLLPPVLRLTGLMRPRQELCVHGVPWAGDVFEGLQMLYGWFRRADRRVPVLVQVAGG